MAAVVFPHDLGCKYARQADNGHSDPAKRLSHTYNTHVIAGARRGGVIAVALADGTSDHTVYDTRYDAVRHQHHNERWYAYVRIGAPHMSICEAESVMRWQRQANQLAGADLDDERSGGLEVIPRLTVEGQRRQLAALCGQLDMPIALGRSIDPR